MRPRASVRLYAVTKRWELGARPVPRSTVLAVAAICTTSLATAAFATESARASTPSSPRVFASFVAVGSEVDASGTVGAGTPPGAGKRSRWEVDLQQRVGARWLTRITGRLHSHGRLSGFSLAWPGAAPGHREAMRVEITSGRRVISTSAPHSVASVSPVSIQSTLRSSTVQPSASQVVSVAGDTGGSTVVVLVKGARVPAVGATLVIDSSTKAPSGVLGVVTSVTSSAGDAHVTTKPGTLEDAYSSFDAHLNGELGQIVDQNATTATVHGPRRRQPRPVRCLLQLQ